MVKSLPERRLTATERRAGRRFVAYLMDKFPLLARVAYPIRGEDQAIYVRMPIPLELATIIDEFAAPLTGLIFEQEKIQVFLISDEFADDQPITNDAELKIAQAQMSCDIDCLRKLRKFKDLEANNQRKQYQERYKLHTERILAYLRTPTSATK